MSATSSIRCRYVPRIFVVGKNYITDKQVSPVVCRDGSTQMAEWYQFKIPLSDYERVVGSINDFSTVRFMRMFMTGFKSVTHLRFATLELVRGEWRPYSYSLNTRGDSPAEGELDISVVNIEENAGREPVNYVLPGRDTCHRPRTVADTPAQRAVDVAQGARSAAGRRARRLPQHPARPPQL